MSSIWQGRVEHPDGRATFSCPKPMCYYHVLLGPHTTEEHRCPHIGTASYSWSETVGLVEEIWQKLDKVVDALKMDPKPEDFAYADLRGQARAYAETLVLFMRPLYNTVDDISREAGVRYKARKAGNDDYETPGIAHAKYKTLMDGEVWYRGVAGWTDDPAQATGGPTVTDDAILNRAHSILAIALERAPLRVGGALPLKSVEQLKAEEPVTHNFSDEEVQKLKTFHQNGFAPEDLARIHGVSVGAINAALAS